MRSNVLGMKDNSIVQIDNVKCIPCNSTLGKMFIGAGEHLACEDCLGVIISKGHHYYGSTWPSGNQFPSDLRS